MEGPAYNLLTSEYWMDNLLIDTAFNFSTREAIEEMYAHL